MLVKLYCKYIIINRKEVIMRKWYFVNEYNCEGGKQIACHGCYSHRHLAFNKMVRVSESMNDRPHTIIHVEHSTEVFDS